MPEAFLPAPVLLAGALLCAFVGLAWLALAMEPHWQQARNTAAPPRGTVRLLRALGATALAASLLLCLAGDHPTMAALVWFMALAVAAIGVALLLAWRPRWVGCLAGRRGRHSAASAGSAQRPSV
ncbi:DUF3325 domain-containing protein [Aquincola tertiaricarbonis]|uniref:DUF3325 domain-containing protein n=1 Tax=Aquincola tertiaricarbonis TaxID=391953 RepID=UPI000614F496|nr:DUF3325 domain-containing protein [Aquincola tertiaricarbonis]